MTRNSKTAIAALLTGAFVALPLASAFANCPAYAKLSLQQQQENVRKGCGFSGPEWQADMKGLIAWCSKVSPQEAQEMLKKRSAQLAGCKG